MLINFVLIFEKNYFKIGIYVTASVVAREPLVRKANAFVHWAISAIQMIEQSAVVYVVNVKSITIARVRKFASNLVAVFVIVSMHAVNSNADQMRYVCRATIDRHASVSKATPAMQMILD